jgi:phage terminase small subunit
MANHPHDPKRPESAAVRKALEADDMEALRDALSYRQRRFCEEYVLDFNGSAAVIRAGYSPNYPDRQAHVLLKNKGIARYVDHLQMSKESKIQSINPEYLIQKLTEIMNRPGIRAADELRAIEMAMKHLGMFIDRTEITGKDGDAIRIEQQRITEEAEAFRNAIKMMQERSAQEKEKKDVTLV